MPPRDGNSKLGHPDVAGWVLGALDPDDAERFGDHVLFCEECQAAMTELEPLARLLQNFVAELNEVAVKPPAGLGARTLTRVEWAARLADAEAAHTRSERQAKVGAQAEAGVHAAGPDAPPTVPEGAHIEPDIDFRGQRPGAIIVWPPLRNHHQPRLCHLQAPERNVGELVGGAELEGHAAVLVRAGPGRRAFRV